MIGDNKLSIDKRLGQWVAICHKCGCPLHYRDLFGKDKPIASAETGYVYCSNECAKEDVKNGYGTREVPKMRIVSL